MERALDQFGLRGRRPDDVAWPLAVAEAGSVERDHPVVLSRQINKATGVEVLDHAAIAVKKHQRRARAAFDIVQPNAIDLQEAAGGWIGAFGRFGKAPIDE